MAYRNVAHSEKFNPPHWWQGEVQDATGAWFHLDGIWALTQEDAEKDFAKTADSWSTYTHPPAEVYEKQMDEFYRDIAMWGCE